MRSDSVLRLLVRHNTLETYHLRLSLSLVTYLGAFARMPYLCFAFGKDLAFSLHTSCRFLFESFLGNACYSREVCRRVFDGEMYEAGMRSPVRSQYRLAESTQCSVSHPPLTAFLGAEICSALALFTPLQHYIVSMIFSHQSTSKEHVAPKSLRLLNVLFISTVLCTCKRFHPYSCFSMNVQARAFHGDQFRILRLGSCKPTSSFRCSAAASWSKSASSSATSFFFVLLLFSSAALFALRS